MNTRNLPICGDYPADWKQISDATWASAGHRCIRCGHPYRKGEHGKGEWTACDEHCTHGGPLAQGFGEGVAVAVSGSTPAGVAVKSGMTIFAQWRIGTVHHFDGDKANCEWWNLMALCQRCHLTVQSRVNPQQPYMFEHSEWAKPYIAGFYAWKYECRRVTRQEAEAQMERLLTHERLA